MRFAWFAAGTSLLLLGACGDDADGSPANGGDGGSSSRGAGGDGGSGGDEGSGGGEGVGGGDGGAGGGEPAEAVRIEALLRDYLPAQDQDPATLVVRVRLTNVAASSAIGVQSDLYAFSRNGIVRPALAVATDLPCEAGVALEVGASYECSLAFESDTPGGGGSLRYADEVIGVEAEVDVPDLPPTGFFAACNALLGEDPEDPSDCAFCLLDDGACGAALGGWAGGCRCPSGDLCCDSMDFRESCAFTPELEACFMNPCGAECS